MKLSKISAAILAATISSSSFAETILDDIYVTDKSKIINNHLQTTYSTQVFTQKEIKTSGANDLSQFLTQNTTLQVQPQYGNPMAALIDMNGYGLESGHNNIQIIVDGVSLNAIDSAPVILNFIDLDAISEIAIVRGAGSVLYGNGATAGALVITTTPGYSLPDQVKASLYLGSYNTSKQSITIHKNGKLNNYKTFVDINVNLYKTEGSIEIESENSKNESKNSNVGFKVGLSNQGTSYVASISKSSGDTLYPNPISITDFHNKPDIARASGTSQEFDNKKVGLSINHKITADSKAHYKLSQEDRSSAYSGSAPSDFNQTEHQLDFKTRFNKVVLNYGGSLKHATRDSADFLSIPHKTTRDDFALFTSANIQLNEHVLLNAGYRKQNFDYNYKKSGLSTKESYDLSSYNLGSSWLINTSNSVYLNFNHAFNAPNIDWLFNYDGSFNGLVSPMESNTAILGYKYQTNNTDITAEFFSAKLKDELFLDPSLGFFGANTNIDESSKNGLNLSIKHFFTNAVIGADYNYVEALVDKEAGTSYREKRLPGVSDHTIKLFAEYDFNSNLIPALPQNSMRITHKASSDLYAISDFTNANGLKPGYTSTDISYKLANKIASLQVGINNIFNQKNGLYSYNSVYTTNYERAFYLRADLAI